MDQVQWELCELSCGDVKEQGEKGTRYSVWVRYYAPGFYEWYHLAETKGKNSMVWSYNPFRRAVSILLEAGWEPLSFQYASGVAINWDQAVGIFRRPYQQGRATDEPKLVELLQTESAHEPETLAH